MSDQRNYLDILLAQWENAAVHQNNNGTNEIHITGDMNLDSLHGRWLDKNYYLYSLAKMIESACCLGNFSQMVNAPTRFQYNSIRNLSEFHV